MLDYGALTDLPMNYLVENPRVDLVKQAVLPPAQNPAAPLSLVYYKRRTWPYNNCST